MNKQLRRHALALCLLVPTGAFVALPTAAAPRAARSAPAPVIEDLQVDADSGLASGSELEFTVQGTPRSTVRIALANGKISLNLRETSAGTYQGAYTVRRADRINPASSIRVSLSSGKRSTVTNYTYPSSFIVAANPPPPPAAPPPPVAPPPELVIERFAALPVGRIEPGAVLRFRLNGAPGAAASFSIPRVVDRVPMPETRPGHYEGSYTVRNNDRLDAIDGAVATLRAGTRVVTADLRRIPIRDNNAPGIGNMTPRQGEVVAAGRPLVISATFDDAGGLGVDPSTVRISLSGRDITGESRITPSDFAYRVALLPGRQTVEVLAKDRAGNTTSKSWTFEAGTTTGSTPALPGGVLAPQLVSHANNAAIDGGRATLQGKTLPGATVRVKVDAVSPVGGNRFSVAQPVTSQTVQADASGNFSFSFGPERIIFIPGTRYEVVLEATHNGQTAESRLVLFQRERG